MFEQVRKTDNLINICDQELNQNRKASISSSVFTCQSIKGGEEVISYEQ